MGRIDAVAVGGITGVGSNEDGDQVHLSLDLPGQPPVTFSFPHHLIPKLLLALQTGAGLAVKQRLARHGTIKDADRAHGVQPLTIESTVVTTATHDQTGAQVVLLQARTEQQYSFDLVLPGALSLDLADKLKQAAEETQSSGPRKLNS